MFVYPCASVPMCPCTHVPVYPCTCVPLYPCTHVPGYPCAHVPFTQRPVYPCFAKDHYVESCININYVTMYSLLGAKSLWGTVPLCNSIPVTPTNNCSGGSGANCSLKSLGCRHSGANNQQSFQLIAYAIRFEMLKATYLLLTTLQIGDSDGERGRRPKRGGCIPYYVNRYLTTYSRSPYEPSFDWIL